ncbi:MAG: hypothetical protein EOO89_01260 [Pedobacter sp.]|nr:MAG: hypothetical protein EOO89_01260 [Pedobacter sp.]
MKKIKLMLAVFAFVGAIGVAFATSSSLPDEAKLWDGSGYNINSTPEEVEMLCQDQGAPCGYTRIDDVSTFYQIEE